MVPIWSGLRVATSPQGPAQPTDVARRLPFSRNCDGPVDLGEGLSGFVSR
jgi:hypothetical protein